ncbi:mitochondrial carrier [Mytilinidion resinicola]|uniref:Mitochondrial carrier n=1 Tax=Mytilinidion resinicola TaxID=574789 RepID=A0A6A6YLA4_9PEZI|nr:mitochondrial carrier [Mytilinidion resinicola]KAF2809343.1 mitochondrial carrier [Mytilinidion resinicola]
MPDGSNGNRNPALRTYFSWNIEDAKWWTKHYRTEIAASTASMLATGVTYPLDSTKTRMQVSTYNSVRDCIRKTYQKEGLSGFWRGAFAPLVSITVVRTVSFSVYQRSKYLYDGWMHRSVGVSPLMIANTKGATPNLATVICFGAAGATAGVAITAIACPFELIKLSAQTAIINANKKSSSSLDEPLRGSYQGLGTFRTARKLVHDRGFKGLYSGFHLHLLRDSIGTGVYFMAYESAKQFLANARGNSPTTPTAVVIAGGLCGLVSWAVIYPIDTTKSQYQRNCLTSHKDRTVVPKIQYGRMSMYQGLTVSMTRSCILNAIFFSLFEYTKKGINRLEVNEELLSRRPSK